MLRRSWRVGLVLLVLLGCGDKTEVKVAEAPSGATAEDPGKPVTGDWLVIHSLSDPELLNPLTSSDASASEVLNYVFESLLTRNPKTLELNRGSRRRVRRYRRTSSLTFLRFGRTRVFRTVGRLPAKTSFS